MKEKKKNTKILLPILLVALLIAIVGGATYAFFNYTRTGEANVIRTGNITFNSNYENVELNNIFPIAKSNVLTDTNNVMTVNVNIEGDTTYEKGIYYEVKADDVRLTVNGKNIPIGISVTSSNLSNVTLTSYEDGKILTNNSVFAEGRILASDPNNNIDNSVDGTITIKAYIDRDRIAITDTIENGAIIETGYVNGTTNGWINGRVVLTTEEWNSFASTPLSFKVKVEAIENDVSTLVDGQTFIGKVKKLADPTLDTSNQYFWATQDNNITTFERVMEKPDTTGFTDENVISTIESAYPIYAWYENGIIKYYSESENIKANKNMTYMFVRLQALNDIGDLASLDMTNVTSMDSMFMECIGIESLNLLSNWNVSNVSNMNQIFGGCAGITSLTPIANWNVSNVNNMSTMFANCTGITSLDPLANWNVSNVTSMSRMFDNTRITSLTPLTNWNVSNVTAMLNMFASCTGITSLTPLANWNVSNVTAMNGMFIGCTGITSLNPLANWNVSNVTDMGSMFSRCTGITTLSPLSNWNVSNVTRMQSMFSGCTGITSLSPLANWNVSNVTNMYQMFADCTSLSDASGINDWNITKVRASNFKQMFKDAPSHPEFTKRAGTWDANGTFTPNA